MKSKTFGTLIGSFGKGISGSVTVNFGVSGGKNCSDECPLKESGACYAVTTEAMKPSITKNLEKKEADIVGYTSELASPKAIAKLNSAPWVRGSAFGSIPENMPKKAKDNLRIVAENVNQSKFHFPVETLEKGRMLREIGFNPRVSAATNETKAESIVLMGFNASLVVQGDKLARGKNKRLHSAKAFAKAKELNAKGIKTKVCPAIAGSAKCGDCKLCADKSIDVIIYPMH